MASPIECVNNLTTRKSLVDNGQHPYATIITCADSRVPPEAIFGACLCDFFVCRNAGNLVDDYVLGSVEYAIEHLKTPLVVIMGHTGCGAVGAAIESMKTGKEPDGALGKVVEKIKVAAEKFMGDTGVIPTAEQIVDYSASLSRADIYASPVVLYYAQKSQVMCFYSVYNTETSAVTI